MITGVWQGCILSSIFYAVAIDCVLKKAMINQGTECYERNKLSDLDFADDFAALSDSTQGLQGLMSATGEVTGGLGLSINDKKI